MGNSDHGPTYTYTARVGKTNSLSLPTETKVESGTSQSKYGTYLNLSNSGYFPERGIIEPVSGWKSDG